MKCLLNERIYSYYTIFFEVNVKKSCYRLKLFQKMISGFKLTAIELIVEAAATQQGLMVALLHDLSVPHHQDHVGGFDCGKTVRYDKGCSPLHHKGKGVLDLQLHTGVDGGGRLVQNQHGRKT